MKVHLNCTEMDLNPACNPNIFLSLRLKSSDTTIEFTINVFTVTVFTVLLLLLHYTFIYCYI